MRGHPGHYGLGGMRERARLLGGELAVWSERDSDTEVERADSCLVSMRDNVPLDRRSWLAETLSGKDLRKRIHEC